MGVSPTASPGLAYFQDFLVLLVACAAAGRSIRRNLDAAVCGSNFCFNLFCLYFFSLLLISYGFPLALSSTGVVGVLRRWRASLFRRPNVGAALASCLRDCFAETVGIARVLLLE